MHRVISRMNFAIVLVFLLLESCTSSDQQIKYIEGVYFQKGEDVSCDHFFERESLFMHCSVGGHLMSSDYSIKEDSIYILVYGDLEAYHFKIRNNTLYLKNDEKTLKIKRIDINVDSYRALLNDELGLRKISTRLID